MLGQKPSRGVVEIKSTADELVGIARTLQGLGLWPGLTVKENVVAGSTRRPGVLSSVLALPHADRLESEP